MLLRSLIIWFMWSTSFRDLSTNRIALVETGAFRQANIEYLYLWNNPLSTIQTNAFSESDIR